MGKFRDLFTEWFGKIKDVPEKLKEIKEKISSIAEFFEEGKGESPGFWDWLKDYWFESKKWFYVQTIKQFDSVSKLEKGFKTMPGDIVTNAEIIVVYEERKEKLAAQGYNTPLDRVLNPVAKGIKGGVKLVTEAALENLSPILDDFLKDLDIPEADKAQIRKVASSGEFGLNAVVGFMLGHFLSPVLSTALAPAWETMGQEAWKKLPVRLLDEGRLLYLIFRYPEEADIYKEELKRKGYSDDRIAELEKAFLYYPSPKDFIHYAVRETFDNKVAEKYGYDEHYPKEMEEYVRKAGMNPEWLKHEWRAHWAMISPRMAYEMLQREEIDIDMLRDILKIADYPPYLIEKMINISYARITRVDLRRLYSSGEIDFEAMEMGYRHLGFSPTDANKLAIWTQKEYGEKDKDIAQGKIMKGYNLGEISVEICLKSLISLGYDEDESKYLIALEDYSIIEKNKVDEAETLIEEVVNGTKTIEALENGLKALILRPKEISKYRDKATRKVRALIKQPTEGKLSQWFTLGLINSDTYRKRLAELRYTPTDIELFIKEGEGEQ